MKLPAINKMTEASDLAFQRARELYQEISQRATLTAASEGFYHRHRITLVAGAICAWLILIAEIAGFGFIGYMLGVSVAADLPWLQYTITGAFVIFLCAAFHFLFAALVPTQPFGGGIYRKWRAIRNGRPSVGSRFNVYSIVEQRRRQRDGWLTFTAVAAIGAALAAARYYYFDIQDGSAPTVWLFALNVVAGVSVAAIIAYAYAYFVTYLEVSKVRRYDAKLDSQLVHSLRRFVDFAGQIEYWYEAQDTHSNGHQLIFRPTTAIPLGVENLLQHFDEFRELGKTALIPTRQQIIRVMDGSQPAPGTNVILQFDDHGRLSELTDSQGYVCFDWRSFSDTIAVIEINGLTARNVKISDAPLTIPLRTAVPLSPSQQLN